MKLTKRKLSILTLALIALLCVCVFFSINTFTAQASDYVTVSGSNVFTSSGNAQVGGVQLGEASGGQASDSYITFTFSSDDDIVSYRRNTAYHWFEEVTTTVGEGDNAQTTSSVKEGYFNLEIGFKSTKFEKFIITFESQQYNKTKDAKTQNYVIFFPASESTVYAVITDDGEYELKDGDKTNALTASDIYIEFTGKYTEDFTGGYNVIVGNKTSAEGAFERSVEGKLKNVGGNYAKYSSSSTTPVYPLIFNTVFDKNDEGEKVSSDNVQMIIFTLNGQGFKTEESGTGATNRVTDNKAPVLCLNKDVSYFKLNGKLDIDYLVIDVLRSSPPTPTIKYYVLSEDQYEGKKDLDDKSLFGETKSSDNVILSSDRNTYLPSEADLASTVFAPNYVVNDEGELVANTQTEKPLCDLLVKVYLEIADLTGSSAEKADIFLDWYVDDAYLININSTPFIAVAKEEYGVQYNYGYGTEEELDNWNTLVDEYQAKIDELAKNLSAGSLSYLYLPSPESLFSDNVTSYTDMTFSIYYNHGSKQSSTNLSSNNLSINITKEGTYVFTIYATDTAGNSMYYYEKAYEEEALNEDGTIKSGYIMLGDEYYEIVKFAASDIWTMLEDKDVRNKLPWFTFYAGYKGVEFKETPGKQSTAYVGTTYSSAKFDINGISGSYTTTYKLYVFDSARYFKEHNVIFSYDSFIDVMDGLFDNAETHIYFNEIPAVTETDTDYDKYKDYGWSNSSTTFTPQEANTFYYIVAEVKDTGKITDPVTCSLAVVATDAASELRGESDWLKNNVASIVLLSVAGASLIGIVLLIVIKPKNKEDVDVQFEKVTAKKGKK